MGTVGAVKTLLESAAASSGTAKREHNPDRGEPHWSAAARKRMGSIVACGFDRSSARMPVMLYRSPYRTCAFANFGNRYSPALIATERSQVSDS